MPKIKVYTLYNSELIIDSSGQHGNDGLNAHFDIHGQHGKNALDIQLSLSIKNDMLEVDIANMGPYYIPLKEAKVIVKANGGDGGNGGIGIQGASGHDGYHGARGQSGEHGGDGAVGGPGGNGGYGGHAGNVTIKIKENEQFLVDLVKLELKGGRAGLGGLGGKGGRRGLGGRGGSSYSWEETYYGPTSLQSYTKYHNVSGGLSGMDGIDGRPGLTGEHGGMGRDGALKIELEKVILESLPKTAEPLKPEPTIPGSYQFPYESKETYNPPYFPGFSSNYNWGGFDDFTAWQQPDKKGTVKPKKTFESMLARRVSLFDSILAVKNAQKDPYIPVENSRVTVEIENDSGDWVPLKAVKRNN